MRIAFLGTPDFSVPALDALRAAGHEVACVYAQPPRPAGRGQSERRSAVHDRADAAGIPVRTPATRTQIRLHQYSCLAVAALARRGADSARDPGG